MGAEIIAGAPLREILGRITRQRNGTARYGSTAE
jgi:hypothetical protein